MSVRPPSLFTRLASALNPFRFGNQADRRRAVRLEGHEVSCSMGEIQDISATGVRVRCRRFYRPYEGNGVTLQIEPIGGRERVILRGVVCWTTHEDGHWYAGVAFGAMAAEDARVLGSIIRASTEPDLRLADAA